MPVMSVMRTVYLWLYHQYSAYLCYQSVMARHRFERLPAERKEAILRTAAAEFAENGFHGTSYNQLLERLEFGKSSAYYYFDDKRDLFLTALGALLLDVLREHPRRRAPEGREKLSGGSWKRAASAASSSCSLTPSPQA